MDSSQSGVKNEKEGCGVRSIWQSLGKEAHGSHTRDNSGEADSEFFSELELAKVVIIWMWMAKEVLKATSLSLEHLVIVPVAIRFASTP